DARIITSCVLQLADRLTDLSLPCSLWRWKRDRIDSPGPPGFIAPSPVRRCYRFTEEKVCVCGRTSAARAMRLPAPPASVGLITCSLVIMLPLLVSCHPALTSGQHSLVFMEQLSRSQVGFNWRNITCPLCKAVFTILDIALLSDFSTEMLHRLKRATDASHCG
ncbi:hypothetical protein INR49_027547, partial [Caranx melampygus]